MSLHLQHVIEQITDTEEQLRALLVSETPSMVKNDIRMGLDWLVSAKVTALRCKKTEEVSK